MSQTLSQARKGLARFAESTLAIPDLRTGYEPRHRGHFLILSTGQRRLIRPPPSGDARKGNPQSGRSMPGRSATNLAVTAVSTRNRSAIATWW